MAGSVNKVIIVGNLGTDPEIRRFGDSGSMLAVLNIATSENWRDKNGERRERTEWHRVVIYNENLTKIVEQYLKKGSKVYLEGQLQTRKWQDQNGIERYRTEIVLQNYRGELHMLDSRGSSITSAASTANYSHDNSSVEHRKENFPARDFSRDLDDEIPF